MWLYRWFTLKSHYFIFSWLNSFTFSISHGSIRLSLSFLISFQTGENSCHRPKFDNHWDRWPLCVLFSLSLKMKRTILSFGDSDLSRKSELADLKGRGNRQASLLMWTHSVNYKELSNVDYFINPVFSEHLPPCGVSQVSVSSWILLSPCLFR